MPPATASIADWQKSYVRPPTIRARTYVLIRNLTQTGHGATIPHMPNTNRLPTRQHDSYTTEYIAAAVVLAEAEGWPQERGAIARAARTLDIPHSTLQKWADDHLAEWHRKRAESEKKRQTKRGEIIDKIEDALLLILPSLQESIEGASLRDKAVAIGILADKLAILSGKIGNVQRGNVLVQIRNEIAPWQSPGNEAIDTDGEIVDA